MADHRNEALIRDMPKHVAIIMDGNGRWAAERGWPRDKGHRAGTENILRVLREFSRNGIKYVTLFGFSTENWGRPSEEVQSIIEILGEAIGREVGGLHDEGVCINHIGSLGRLSPKLKRDIARVIDLTKGNKKLILSVAFDYGGRAEIIDAFCNIVNEGLPIDQINEEVFGRHLYTADLPDPDLIIRTAGEMRLSNFLLWQSAYSEFYSAEVFWPDFDEKEVDNALVEYSQRKRRYGKLDLV